MLFQRIASYRDPRLYAMSLLAEQLSKSTQPLVPERVFVAGAAGGDGRGHGAPTTGLLGLLVSLLVAEKSGFQNEAGDPAQQDFRTVSRKVTPASAGIGGEERTGRAEVTVSSRPIPSPLHPLPLRERAG